MIVKPHRRTRPRRHAIPKVLFLCGVGRSGTTALARCLNRHPKIVMGIERYARTLTVAQRRGFDYLALFEKERFFEFRPSDSPKDASTEAALYADARRRYDDATYVGDKVPGLFRRIPFLHDAFPACKVVYLLRDPVAVATSWQARAENPRDSWPRKNGFAAAVAEWNKALTTTMVAKSVLGKDLIVALYEDVFAEGAPGLARLLSRLDLQVGDMCEDVAELLAAGRRIVGRKGDADPALEHYVARNADYETYQWFREEACA